MASFLLFVLAVFALIWGANHISPKAEQTKTNAALRRRNQDWTNFIAGYLPLAKTKAEKELLQHMLQDVTQQGLGVPPPVGPAYGGLDDTPAPRPSAAQWDQPASVPLPASYTEAASPTYQTLPEVQLDNTSLLLYFGAFLFVAAVGLFIGLGTASGGLKTLAVLIVMTVMYGGGIWLYRNRPKLGQAALTFVGIGIVIAPLVGVAAYTYLFHNSAGPLVWFWTSVLSLGLYVHALLTLRKTLIGYLIIFSFISLFESGVSVIQAPIYYYGWALALLGIILQMLPRFVGSLPELQDASRYSAQFLLPIALLGSIALVPARGALQLGVSLLLAAAFYALQALSTEAEERQLNAAASQVTALASVASITYGLSHHWSTVGVALVVANLVQLVLIALRPASRLMTNFASILLLSNMTALVATIQTHDQLFATTAWIAMSSVAVWALQRRADAYGLASLAWMALPFLYGSLLVSPRLSATVQTVLGLGALLVLTVVYVARQAAYNTISYWRPLSQLTYVVGALAVLVASLFAGPVVCLLATVVIVLFMAVLAEFEHTYDWAEIAGLFLIVPAVRGSRDGLSLVAVTFVALVVSIAMSLRYRRELLRWLSTGWWLLLPLALGHSFQFGWTPTEYAWAYFLACVGLIISRAVARGVIFVSGRIPLASYARTASLSYVVGYAAAMILAVCISLYSDNSHLHTSLILALALPLTWLVSLVIEKKAVILAVIPVILQTLWLSLTRPSIYGHDVSLFVLGGTAIALASYWVSLQLVRENSKLQGIDGLVPVSLVTAFIAPGSILYLHHPVWAMPVGLFAAGCMLYDYVRPGKQSKREWAGALITASILWLLYVLGVHQLQVYVHIIVLNLIIYAYWRAVRGEPEQSDSYITAALLTATIPLGLQALSGAAGGVYGWWLLLEQVVIMLVGMALQKRRVTLWGLYVSLGAVLYQLRHLGYAALAILAMFLIGLAVYQLQRQGTHD